MMKSVIAVVLGVVCAALIVFGAEAAGHMLFPSPDIGIACAEPETSKSKDSASACMAALPAAAKLAVVAGWFLGSLGGAIVSLLIGGRWAPLAWITAGTILLLTLVNFSAFPHPAWMLAAGVAAPILGGFCAIALAKARYARAVAAPTPKL
jgi:hypothetical protein